MFCWWTWQYNWEWQKYMIAHDHLTNLWLLFNNNSYNLKVVMMLAEMFTYHSLFNLFKNLHYEDSVLSWKKKIVNNKTLSPKNLLPLSFKLTHRVIIIHIILKWWKLFPSWSLYYKMITFFLNENPLDD